MLSKGEKNATPSPPFVMASSAFDSDSKLLFESCSDLVVSVLRQITPDFYELVDTVKTQPWARTLALDSTRRVCVKLMTRRMTDSGGKEGRMSRFGPDIASGATRDGLAGQRPALIVRVSLTDARGQLSS